MAVNSKRFAVSSTTRERFLGWTDVKPPVFVLPNSIRLSDFGPGTKPEYLLERYGLANRRILGLLQHLHAVDARHLEIDDEDRPRLGLQPLQRGGAVGRGGHEVAVLLQPPTQRLPDDLLVVDHQDACPIVRHDAVPSSQMPARLRQSAHSPSPFSSTSRTLADRPITQPGVWQWRSP